ncbi:hypothetical protein PR003_g28232 [Phytophthora rubi]|uniref:C2H2-type domain-containing protein n=1 Tax=Phytophthora rubi TaxID=129364 RepID=A0A6A4BVI9_9STRA|nr:hypothetical protein PR003_g28232 [Phytophthora rubi]
MQVRERFATKGYVIFYGAVHDDTIKSWRSIARQTNGWFEEEVIDMTEEQVRVEAAVPDQDAREMSRLLQRFYRTFFPATNAHDWHFNKTPAGTEDQPPRREFLTSLALRSNRRLLDLNKGDIVLFRGDFILASVGYDTNNICLHAYLDSPFYDRPDDHHPTVVPEIDDSRGIDDPFCIVWNCTFKGTPLSLRRHLNRYHGIRLQRTARHLEP